MYIVHTILYGCAMGAVYGICVGGYQEIKKYIQRRKEKQGIL